MRRRHVMRRELSTVPAAWAGAPGPVGVAFEGPGRTAAELAGAFVAAYPPEHPDHVAGWDPEEEEARILDGRECGPLLDCTRFAVAAGRVVGAVLVTLIDDDHPVPPGPLIADALRHPDAAWRGLGAALLRRSCAAAAQDGYASIGLLVTAGNPAQRVYESLGFEVVETHPAP
jgi:ribosomal protein S18 acetylase RimI-like enzyme